jgi:hypothetical protein
MIRRHAHPSPRSRTRRSLCRSALLILLAAGVTMAGLSSIPPAYAATTSTTTHLANGETITRYANGDTFYTAPMRLAGTAEHGAHPDGYGQNRGNCGTAKLWTYASNNTYQLSLIGNPGVRLGLGAAETQANGFTAIPSWVGITAVGQTWTSGRVGIWPGFYAWVAWTSGDDQTSIGNCIIAVAAQWSLMLRSLRCI